LKSLSCGEGFRVRSKRSIFIIFLCLLTSRQRPTVPSPSPQGEGSFFREPNSPAFFKGRCPDDSRTEADVARGFSGRQSLGRICFERTSATFTPPSKFDYVRILPPPLEKRTVRRCGRKLTPKKNYVRQK
jgi:hypothetical protein